MCERFQKLREEVYAGVVHPKDLFERQAGLDVVEYLLVENAGLKDRTRWLEEEVQDLRHKINSLAADHTRTADRCDREFTYLTEVGAVDRKTVERVQGSVKETQGQIHELAGTVAHNSHNCRERASALEVSVAGNRIHHEEQFGTFLRRFRVATVNVTAPGDYDEAESDSDSD